MPLDEFCNVHKSSGILLKSPDNPNNQLLNSNLLYFLITFVGRIGSTLPFGRRIKREPGVNPGQSTLL